MPKDPACEDEEVLINIMRLRRICPRWSDPSYPSAKCWCDASRQPDKKTANCPDKPDGWKQGMLGSVEVQTKS